MSALPFDRLADWDGKCPECDSPAFIERHKGGTVILLECTGCGTWVNQTDMLALGGRKLAQRLTAEQVAGYRR